MDTPIQEFAQSYALRDVLRLHMPGHKGLPILGVEKRDITEIPGADSLYEASGIIRRSEENASSLFGCPTFYSTEGSSQCIRAMVYLAALAARRSGQPLRVAAGRNAHKTFLSAAALLDAQVDWLYPEEADPYLSCHLSPDTLEQQLQMLPETPTAVYVTSPDYLGNQLDIAALAEIAHRHGALLLVDCAHGAYLRFLPQSRHPIDLGADLVCASAHKTLPVLTGGAYLHVGEGTALSAYAKDALALFGSTSPSYLILQSLDAANAYLETYPQKLAKFLPQVEALKTRLNLAGFALGGDEPLKLTLLPKSQGYTGTALASLLEARGIVAEFADPDNLVLMLTPELGAAGLRRLEDALAEIPSRAPLLSRPPASPRPERVLSIRQAVLSLSQRLPVEDSGGHILAAATVGCPPAVPVVVCGERIDGQAIACFQYYGIDRVAVVAR